MAAEMPVQKNATEEPKAAPARRRWFGSTARRAMAINVMFGLLIGASVYGVTERNTLFQWWMGFSGAGNVSGVGQSDNAKEAKDGAGEKPGRLVGEANLPPDDPVLRFAETRVGQLLFASSRTDNCQRVLFNNRTGVSFDVPGVFCGPVIDTSTETNVIDRLEAVRASFRKQ